jgi:hypothetical protein
MTYVAYQVGSFDCDAGFIVERIYLDRDEAEMFVAAYNEFCYVGEYEIREIEVGRPTVEYDGPVWTIEWIEGTWVTPSVKDGPYWFTPFWSEEKLIHKSDWHSGERPESARVTLRRARAVGPCMVTVKGCSKVDVEELSRVTIAEVKAETHAALSV